MNITGNHIAQWVVILGGFLYFLYRETKSAGIEQAEQTSTQAELTELKSAVVSRFEKLEAKAYGNGEGGFITMRHFDSTQAACRGSLQKDLNNIARQQEKMDASREGARIAADNRLGKIERSMAGMAADLKHILKEGVGNE